MPADACTIFLVDDEPRVLRSMARMASHAGHKVRSFSRPEDALSALALEKPDMVLTDYYMPGIDGVAFLERVLQQEPSVGRIVVTGGYVDDRLRHAHASGTVQVLVRKPWDASIIRGLRDRIALSRVSCERVEYYLDGPLSEELAFNNHPHVLLVDDDRFFLELTASMLGKLGCRCTCLESGAGLKEKIERGDCDVVVLDLVVPELDVPELIGWIREHRPGLPVLVISGCAGRDLAVEALLKGANCFLSKPLDAELLEVFIRRAVQFRRLLSESICRTDLHALLDLQHAIASGLSSPQVFNLLLQQMIRCTRAEGACILRVDSESRSIHVAASYGSWSNGMGEQIELGDDFSAWMSDFCQPQLLMPSGQDDPRLPMHFDHRPSIVLCVPMRGRTRLLGVLCLYASKEADLCERSALDLGMLLASEAARVVEREVMADEQRDIEQSVMQRDKLVTIGELASGVAHEINNPLAFVSSNINTLQEYFQDVSLLLERLRQGKEGRDEIERLIREIDLEFLLEDLPKCLAETRNGIQRVLHIVEDLRSIARDDSESRESADVNKLLDGAINILWNQIKYKARLVREYGELPSLRCYPSQLGQLFMNMLYNASQAIERSGTIVVRTRTEGDAVLIEVQDDGVGMDPETARHCFEPFYTTKPRGIGTGLGLSIASKIVARHNGQISVQSERGRGSTFRIRLPVDPSAGAA
ncbi:MAG: response regulator [Deltaproteobacteria bacterium]|nr:response regulator [Deltaproteobacteria bacterium]